MVKITVQMDQVLDGLKNLISASEDLSPVLLKIQGQFGDREPYTVIGSIHRAFLTQGSSTGIQWPELSRSYAKTKQIKWGYKSILIASGDLFESLVFGGQGNVRILEPKKLVYGTTIPYAIYHQSDQPRTKMPYRPFIAVTEDMYDQWETLIQQYMTDMWGGGK